SRIPGPEAVAVARDDGESRDLRVANDAVDFSALCECEGVVRGAHRCVTTVPGPRLLSESRGQVLRIGAHIHRALRVAPDFPRRRRALELVLEPSLLLRSEKRLRRRIPLRVGDMRLVEPYLGGRIAAVEGAPAVENPHQGLRGHCD